jgi:SPP1 gp7 family putative phage head morphogenesis protein
MEGVGRLAAAQALFVRLMPALAEIKWPVVDARRDSREHMRAFQKVRNAENDYSRRLRQVARAIDGIIKGYDHPLRHDQEFELMEALRRYADTLRPWAHVVAQRMIAEVARRDEAAWAKYTKSMSWELRRLLRSTPIGLQVQERLAEQVRLITSLPLEAAQRVHKYTLEARASGGGRAKDLADQIMRTGTVTRSRATLIARTETARTASLLTQVRAQHIGSEVYIWRTVKDSDVRPRHKRLEGKVFRWDDPPVAGENGERAHPGAIYNCRCFAEPVISDLKF